MAEIKFAWYVLQTLGYTSYVWAMIVSFGDAKAWILFFVGLVFAIIKAKSAWLDYLKKNLIMKTIR